MCEQRTVVKIATGTVIKDDSLSDALKFSSNLGSFQGQQVLKMIQVRAAFHINNWWKYLNVGNLIRSDRQLIICAMAETVGIDGECVRLKFKIELNFLKRMITFNESWSFTYVPENNL